MKTSGWHSKLGSTARGYGAAWQRLREQVLKRDRYLCQCSECKRTGRVRIAQHVDHIVPKARGGTDAPSNLQAINRECHVAKTLIDNGAAPQVHVGVDGWALP